MRSKMFVLVCFMFAVLFRIETCLGEQCDNENQTSRFCETLCTGGICEIKVAVILPKDPELSVNSMYSVVPMLRKAISDTYSRGILPRWINIKLIEWDDKCDASNANIAVINTIVNNKCVHVIFGPSCDYCLATVSRTLKFLNIPLLTGGGFTLSFDKPRTNCKDEFFMMVRTGILYFNGLSHFVKSIFVKYGWHKIFLLYEKDGQSQVAGSSTCSFMMQTLVQEMMDIPKFQYTDGDLGLTSLNLTDYLRREIGTQRAIIAMCADRQKINEILLTAEELDQMVYNGEYLFINIELLNKGWSAEQPWKNEEYNNDTSEKLKNAYKSVITVTTQYEESEFSGIVAKSNYVNGFYDAMILYIKTLSNYIGSWSDVNSMSNVTIDSQTLLHNMWNTSYEGYNGRRIQIDSNGDRITYYSLLSLNSDKNKFEVVANYRRGDKSFKFLKGRRIHWPSGLDTPPPDTPTCGFDNSKCPDTSLPGYAILCIISVVSILICLIIFIWMYRRVKLEAEINSMNWRVYWEEIWEYSNACTFGNNGMFNNKHTGSKLTLMSEYTLDANRQIFLPIGYYKTQIVAIKKLAPLKTELSRSELLDLKHMKDLQHEHLVKFYGACLDAPNWCVLTEYCRKGSLQDILENDQFKLERFIKISLIQDLIRGLAFLHKSEIKSHGSLSSTNCVVDSRLVLKITDFGLHFLKKVDADQPDSYAYWRKKLWVAPELLRLKNPPKAGSQKGDVYSFAIIMHEIMIRQGLFYLGDGVDTTPKDIADSVKNYVPGSTGPPRPFIDERTCEEEVAALMRRCWAEDAADRPDFPALKNTIRKLNKEHDSSLLDNLLSRMEQYANNLETLVEERTADYLEEKRKCEELLYQLLPKSVASQLILGQSVIAETYDEVTIYFSDIVGFTELSATSTPLQVVDLLNDLYTCFDSIVEHFDVYKVETIGDAYMVVSGLPVRNNNLHAREIARLSLALLKNVHKFTIRHRPGEELKLRIGMHTGPCVAGVVGLKMPRYCLFGDTVNTASRMESSGQSLKIHVSPTTKEILDTFGTFDLECRGEIEVKGKGTMVTYWLKGERNAVAGDEIVTNTASTSKTNTPPSMDEAVSLLSLALGQSPKKVQTSPNVPSREPHWPIVTGVTLKSASSFNISTAEAFCCKGLLSSHNSSDEVQSPTVPLLSITSAPPTDGSVSD